MRVVARMKAFLNGIYKGPNKNKLRDLSSIPLLAGKGEINKTGYFLQREKYLVMPEDNNSKSSCLKMGNKQNSFKHTTIKK